MEDTLGIISEYLESNLPLRLVSQDWYRRLDTIERYHLDQVMNRYPSLLSLISVSIHAIYDNDVITLATLGRIVNKGINWERVAAHVNENTDVEIMGILSYILNRDVSPNSTRLPDINRSTGINDTLYMISIMRETSDKDFVNLERLIYRFPDVSIASTIQLDIYYRALARAIIFGWIQLLEGRVTRDNIIRIFSRINTREIHQYSYTFLEENNLHPEWFVDAINPITACNNIPPFIWRRLLPTAISVSNTGLAIVLIKKFRNQITDQMKDEIIDMVSRYDSRNTLYYRANLC